MRKIFLTLISFVFGMVAMGQTNFREAAFDDILKAAKAEGKFVFIDFYTDWCGPCKKMARDVFPQKAVGDYMNTRFVCTKINAEKGEGVGLAKTFNIKAYPTFIVLDADRNEKGRFEGLRTQDALQEELERIINPEKSPEKIRARYDSGERTSELMASYAALIIDEAKDSRSRAAYEKAYADADSIVSDFFVSLPDADRFKPENMFIYRSYTHSAATPAVEFMVDNVDRFPADVKAEVDSLARNLLDITVMSYMNGFLDYTQENLQTVKSLLKKTGHNKDGHLDVPFKFIDEYKKGDMDKFIDFCSANFKSLNDLQQAYLVENYGELINAKEEALKKKAARFLRDQLPDMSVNSMYYMMMQIRDLEGDGH